MFDWRFLMFFNVLSLGFFNLFLKKFSSKKNPILISLAINAIPFPFLLLLNKGFPQLSLIWIYPMLSVIFYGMANITSFKAFSKGDVSLIAPLATMGSVFTLMVSVIFLGEALTIQKVVGVLLVFLGMGYLNKKENLWKSLKALYNNDVARLVVLSCLFLALANVNDKFSLQFFNQFSYPSIIFGGAALLFIPYLLIGKKNVGEFKSLMTNRWGFAVLASFCLSVSYVLFISMITQADVSIIVPLSNLSVFIAILLGKHVLKERVENRWFAAALMVVGASLLMMPQLF